MDTSTGLNVVLIPNNDDNYCYFCYNGDIHDGFFVDVCDAKRAIQFAKDVGVTPKYVVTTHHHWDHSRGNDAMVEEFPDIQIVGGKLDNVKACTTPVDDGDKITIGNINIECLHTPCHTKGHI